MKRSFLQAARDPVRLIRRHDDRVGLRSSSCYCGGFFMGGTASRFPNSPEDASPQVSLRIVRARRRKRV